MNYEYDYVNDDGDKIRRTTVAKDTGETEVGGINVSALFEHTGRRLTGDIDILVHEATLEPEAVGNPAVPSNVEVAREARRRIERRRDDRWFGMSTDLAHNGHKPAVADEDEEVRVEKRRSAITSMPRKRDEQIQQNTESLDNMLPQSEARVAFAELASASQGER